MTNHNKPVVPKAEEALDEMKFEVAEELHIPLTHGDNGDLTARECGKIGGNMVRELIEKGEEELLEEKETPHRG